MSDELGRSHSFTPLVEPEDQNKGRQRRAGDLNTRVYEAIKERIFSDQLRPGNKIMHSELAEMLGVSRTPLREALERLCQEGFVVRIPNRGYYVAEIDESELIDLFEVRAALELHAMRRISRIYLSAEQLEQLRKKNLAYEELIREDSTRARMMADRDFHMLLASFAGNALLLKALEAAFERLILKLNIERYSSFRGRHGLSEHNLLLAALDSGDFQAAEAVLADHIGHACERMIAHLEQLNAVKYYTFAPRR